MGISIAEKAEMRVPMRKHLNCTSQKTCDTRKTEWRARGKGLHVV